MAFSKPQLEVYNCPKRFRVLITGRRFGKTHLAMYELLRFASRKPNSKIFYVCLLYTSPSPRDRTRSRMPSSA